MSNLKKNLGYQTVYQILTTCLPLITSPYLSRVLGAEQLGVYSYTNSIVAYFTLFAMLGFVNHGTRSIAAVNADAGKRSRIFSSIFCLQVITSLMAICCYAIYVCFLCNENRIIATIQIVEVLACIININWLFFGLEKFKITVARNTVIRITTVILILLFVKSPEDLWIYAVLMVGSNFLSQAVLWFYVPKIVKLVRVRKEEIIANIKPVLILFIPLAAMSVYHTMDKTMLGIMSTYEQSGFYYNADKVINIPAGIISGFGTVLLPRITSLIGKGEKKQADKLFVLSMKGTIFAASAMAFGIAAISEHFVPVFFGNGYDNCVMLIIVLSPVLIIKGFAFSARYQYLIPNKLDSIYIKSILCGVIVNLIFNSLLIPQMGAMGAVIGTLLAELSACGYQFVSIRKLVEFGKSFLHCILFIMMGLGMFLGVRIVSRFFEGGIVAVLVEIAAGVAIYGFLSLIYLFKANDKEFNEMILGKVRKFRKS